MYHCGNCCETISVTVVFLQVPCPSRQLPQYFRFFHSIPKGNPRDSTAVFHGKPQYCPQSPLLHPCNILEGTQAVQPETTDYLMLWPCHVTCQWTICFWTQNQSHHGTSRSSCVPNLVMPDSSFYNNNNNNNNCLWVMAAWGYGVLRCWHLQPFWHQLHLYSNSSSPSFLTASRH